MLDRLKTPGKNFDLRQWKLTLPNGSEVSAQMLADGYFKPEVFYTDPRTGGMTFRCPNVAGTTPGSKYSRCELREMLKPEGSASDPGNNWTSDRGGVLMARLAVDAVSETGDPNKLGRVVIGQIHAPESEVVRLYFHKLPDEPTGRLYAGMDPVGEGSPRWVEIARGVPLGRKFTYTIRLKGLRLQVCVRVGVELFAVSERIDRRYRGLPLYFKAGVYNQNNTGTDFAQATFLLLKHTHPRA